MKSALSDGLAKGSKDCVFWMILQQAGQPRNNFFGKRIDP